MKTFQKSLIAAALVAGSFAAVAGTAGTTNLLFPYVTTQAGTFTFISIAQQKGGLPVAGSNSQPLHYTYATKAIDATNATACAHINGDGMSTQNDLTQFEIQGKVDLKSAFGDTTSSPKLFPNTAAGNNQHGMLIVNNAIAGAYGAGPYGGAILYGEARIINTANGMALGYSTDDLHTANAANPDFAAGPDALLPNKVISWFAEPAVSTSWYALPLGTEQTMAFDGNLSVRYQVQDATATQIAGGVAGHYNNNEGFQSSTANAAVTCLGTFNRTALLGDLNAPWSVNGGWGNMVTVNALNAFTPTPNLLYKVESTRALGGNMTFVTREPTL